VRLIVFRLEHKTEHNNCRMRASEPNLIYRKNKNQFHAYESLPFSVLAFVKFAELLPRGTRLDAQAGLEFVSVKLVSRA
jgi:hypothetical protein